MYYNIVLRIERIRWKERNEKRYSKNLWEEHNSSFYSSDNVDDIIVFSSIIDTFFDPQRKSMLVWLLIGRESPKRYLRPGENQTWTPLSVCPEPLFRSSLEFRVSRFVDWLDGISTSFTYFYAESDWVGSRKKSTTTIYCGSTLMNERSLKCVVLLFYFLHG